MNKHASINLRYLKLSLVGVLFILLTLLAFGLFSTKASALSGSSFKPGRIIDDSLFYKANTMSKDSIQSFLKAKLPICDTNGTKMYNSTQTRAQWAKANGKPLPPYICLKNYTQNVPGVTNGGSDLCTGSISSGIKSASQIIYDVSRACGISSKVLIVLLQKEQSLVTDDWPWPRQYRSATGYGCPDTAPCDSEYYGFFNQVYQAAKAYKRYKANSENYNYRPFRSNTILWHPNSSCGSSNVDIQNYATAGLYIYTPYRPNSAALSNLYGSGNACSSYGNRNFWRMYNDWFGSSLVNLGFVSLDTPRWMQIKTATSKVNLPSGFSDPEVLNVGQQLFFSSKITIDGKVYLRTRHDTGRNYNKGVLLSTLEAVPLNYEPLSEPRWMEVTGSRHKHHTLTEAALGPKLSSGQQIFFDTKIQIGGQWYLRSRYDTARNINSVIPLSGLKDISLQYQSLNVPRWMEVSVDLYKKHPLNETASGGLISAGTTFKFKTKIIIGGNLYIRTETDTLSNSHLVIPYSKLKNLNYVALKEPRKMQLSRDAHKKYPFTGADIENQYSQGLELFFSSKIYANGEWYLRSKNDSLNNLHKAFLLSDLQDI